jgi:hypothetical protein
MFVKNIGPVGPPLDSVLETNFEQTISPILRTKVLNERRSPHVESYGKKRIQWQWKNPVTREMFTHSPILRTKVLK